MTEAKLYFVSGSLNSAGGVKVINADGSNETVLASGSIIVEADGIEVDVAAGKVYFSDRYANNIKRANRRHHRP